MRVHRRGGGGGGGRGAAAEHRRHDCERRRAVLLLEAVSTPTRRTLAFSVEIGGVRSAEVLNITFFDADLPANVSAVAPSLGPPAGGTRVVVSGDNFGTALRCFFGDVGVHAAQISVSQLECVSPAAAAGSVPLTVDHADGGPRGTAVPFTYFDPGAAPAIASAAPPYAPLAGAAAISVHGANLAPPWHHTTPSYLCRFGDLEVGRGTSTAATFVTGSELRCAAPPSAAAHTVALRIIIDGCASTRARCRSADATTFHYYDPEAAAAFDAHAPLAIDLAARPLAPITLRGSGFTPEDGALTVAFGSVGVAVAAFVTTGEQRVTPPRAAAPRVVTLTVHNTFGGAAGGGAAVLAAYSTPRGHRT